MAEKQKYAVTIRRKDGSSKDVGTLADSEDGAIQFVADDLELTVDEKGNVTGDEDIVQLSAKLDPDAPERMKLR